MRIISGQWGRRKIHIPPNDWPVRPTTDKTREALFNILMNVLNFEGLRALDLFAGTGGISLELLSRGAKQVVSVENHPEIADFLIGQRDEFEAVDRWNIINGPVEVFLNSRQERFDLIFADPPYDWEQMLELPDMIESNQWDTAQTILVIEHYFQTDFDNHPRFRDERRYGQSSLSFFRLH